jgi:hypothetical protein
MDPTRKEPAALLIIDSDLSFAFWLGRLLDQAGYVSLPAQSTRNAAELLFLNDVILEVVIIEAALADAAPFTAELRRTFPGIQAVATLVEGANYDLSGYDAHHTKPSHRDASAAAEWVDFIGTLRRPPQQTAKA